MRLELKIIGVLLLTATYLFASQKDYLQGLEYYDSKAYDKAFPIMLKEAKSGSKAAQYRLADMYEKGLGTKVDYKESIFWFKQAASTYAYTEKEQGSDSNSSYWSSISSQVGDDSTKAGAEYALAKLDTDTPETKKLLNQYLGGGFFGLQPHEANFILPVSYGKDKPPRRSSAFHPNNIPPDLINFSDYDSNTEVEFQISLKKTLTYDLFGMNEYITAAYTQKVWWQLYSDSGPFRETNYLPEIYMTIPTSQGIDDAVGLKAVKFGFVHESNGQEGYRSRSWNRLYLTGMWQWGNLFVSTRAWYRIPESEKTPGYYEGIYGIAGANDKGDDNPDIHNYLGYGDIKMGYLYGDSQFGLLFRNNLRMSGDNKGAIELNYSYPVFDSPNTFFYVKLFNGYGESLIDYNRNVTKAAVGFSFSRGLF